MLTHPLYLIGLVAAGIPIAIHLLHLRRYRKVYFSNVQLLQALQQEHRRKERLRQWLVLAMRILAILFLVLAFCQPVIPHKEGAMQPGGTVVSVYLDNSYSMERGDREGSLLETGRQKAREIAAAYPRDAQFQLLTCDATGSQFCWLSKEEFLEAVGAVVPSPVSAPLVSVALRQGEFLRSAPASNRHAYLVSDFQRSTADIPQYPADSTIYTTFIPLEGGGEAANLYLDTLEFDSPAYWQQASVHVRVTVVNDGNKGVEQLPLRLYAGGKQCAVATVDIAAHSSATAEMVFRLEQGGVVHGYVETADYPITYDDRLYFSINVTEQIPMLVVSGSSENSYLHRLFAGDTLVEYRQMSAANTDYSLIDKQRFIVLDGLHNIPTGLVQALQNFVAEGGTLLVLPTARADAGNCNTLLGLLQAPLLGSWNNTPCRVCEVATDQALYRGVFRGSATDMEMPTVQGHYRLTTGAATMAVPLITLADGSIYLSCTPHAMGRVYLFASPLLPEFTDFVQQALFVPTLYNMALFSSHRQSPYQLLTVTNPIVLGGDYTHAEGTHLTAVATEGGRPLADAIPDLRRIGSQWCLLPHGEVTMAGNYRLVPPAATQLPSEGLSFNYSRCESDFTCWSAKELSQAIQQAGLPNCQVMLHARQSVEDYVRQRTQGTPLWRMCLVLALAALAAETLLLTLPKRKSIQTQSNAPTC